VSTHIEKSCVDGRVAHLRRDIARVCIGAAEQRRDVDDGNRLKTLAPLVRFMLTCPFFRATQRECALRSIDTVARPA